MNDRLSELLNNPPDTVPLRGWHGMTVRTALAYSDRAADWIDAVVAATAEAAAADPEPDTEWVPLAESVGRVAAWGNRDPEGWTITHIFAGVWAAARCGYVVATDADGMVEVVK